VAAEPVLRVYLAGSMCLERGHVLVRESGFPGPQARLAFAVLATRRTEPVGRDVIAEAVWDGAPPPSWDTALRAIVSRLRRLLEEVGVEDGIRSAFGYYRLALPRGAWVDLEAADDAVHRAEAALGDADPDGAIGWALVAAEIAARPFLPGLEGVFVEGWRVRIREIRIRALEARCATLLTRHQFALAARDAATVLDIAPFRETALRLLMRAHVGGGNPAEALNTYERARRLMADELGVDPSAETRTLFAEILAER
jgi:DNA-binding SARP family transcriptional activator